MTVQSAERPTLTDLRFSNPGPFALMTPVTDRGREWIQENIGDDALEFSGGITIEHRFLADIVIGARADGLICEG